MNVEITEYQLTDGEPLTEQEKLEMEEWIIENAPKTEGTWTTENFGFPIVFETSEPNNDISR